MACVLTSESRRLYSWWWDSHIIPKNSKWLQENLADMDTKVKSMIKLIEEDADSFARRAEMYYKKRPELMKLVEELYRAYRALAERYDYVTGELRHAQKALQAAFPDQEPFTLPEESSSSTDPDAQTHRSFGLELEKLCLEKIVLEKKIGITEEEAKMFSEQAVKAEMEVEKLKAALLELTEGKEALQALYAECLEKSYKLQLDLSSAQSDVQCLTTEIVNSTKKLKHVEENCACLEASNQSLEMEVSDLAKKIMLKDQELSDKNDELRSKEVEIFNLKEEIAKLNKAYDSLSSQLELTGLNPESFGSTVKYLQDENLRLKLICEKNGDHEEKIKTVIQKNTDLESSCESLHVENSALVLERIALLSQLHTITVNMQKVIDQKTVLEHSVSAANMELQSHREKSKGLEELCELLNNQKSNLLVERSILASQLESVQKRLQSLENRFFQFEKEKETGNCQMLDLVSSLTVEKQEHESCMMMNQNQLDYSEDNIQELHKESNLKKEELQEELDEAVIAQFENFILHKFVKELEEESYSLWVENRKHIEASKLADNLISKLESEILEQQVEEELLLVEVENLRLGICQVFSSLQIGSNPPAKISTKEIIGNIKDLKQCLSHEEDDKHRLLIENTVISTLLQESELHKEALLNKYETMKDDFFKVNKLNLDLIEANTNLGLELSMLEEEIEERESIQESLTSELQERENELQLLNTEAAKLIFELQTSNTRDILFESKVHELAEVCESVQAETASKDLEIEEMKQKTSVMEGEIEQLQAQLLAYTRVIGSLKASITSLEHNVLTVPNLVVSDNRKVEDVEVKVHPNHNQSDPEYTRGPESLEPNGISDLLEFQTRITALEKVIVETVGRRKRSGMMNIKPKLAKPESEESWNSSQDQHRMLRGKRYLTLDNVNMTKGKAELSEVRDIPLDQGSSSATRSQRGYLRSDGMLIEQLQIAQRIYETEDKWSKLPYEPQIEDLGVHKLLVLNQESKKEKFLQTDAHNLETTVKRGKKASGVDLKTVKQQLEEAEESAVHVANMSVEPTAWKRSERMKWVHLDDGKKSKEGKGVILRDFIHLHGGNGSGRNNRRRRLCCFAPSQSPRPY